MDIRSETSSDYGAIRELLLASFPTSAEADLVEDLRREKDAVISLVAVDDDRLVAHIMLSTMSAPFKALGLAPVAVAFARRRKGIGSRLIEAALQQARAEGWDAVFVLGDPAFYGRFGFSAQMAEVFESPYAGPFLMALALKNKKLPVTAGEISYAPAFAQLE